MQLNNLIALSIREDLGSGDITTDAIFSDTDPLITAFIVAKQEGIICGLDFFSDCFYYLDDSVDIQIYQPNGSFVKTGEIILEIKGKSSVLLKAERVALNFLGHLSGIATLTRKYVKAIEGTNAVILDTRKTHPLYRHIEKFAVRIGGGKNHRFGLYDMILIKDNHIDACGSITNAILKCRNYLEAKNRMSIKIEVEVKDLNELREALDCKPDRILLDNMNVEMIREAVKITNSVTKLEVSGNVDLSNVRAYAETGVDFISVGKITHSAPTFDFSMRIKK